MKLTFSRAGSIVRLCSCFSIYCLSKEHSYQEQYQIGNLCPHGTRLFVGNAGCTIYPKMMLIDRRKYWTLRNRPDRLTCRRDIGGLHM